MATLGSQLAVQKMGRGSCRSVSLESSRERGVKADGKTMAFLAMAALDASCWLGMGGWMHHHLQTTDNHSCVRLDDATLEADAGRIS